MNELDQSITKRLTHHAKKSLIHGQKIAQSAGKKTIRNEHLLYGIYLQKGSVGSTILRNMNLKKIHFEKIIFTKENAKSKKASAKKSHVQATPLALHVKNIITDAYASAADFGYPYVGTEHFVYAILSKPSADVKKILNQGGAQKIKEKHQKPSSKNSKSDQTPEKAIVENVNQPFSPEMLSHIGQILGNDGVSFLKNVDEDFTGALDQFAHNTAATEEDHAFIGYTETIERIATTLGRKNKNNPLLVGSPGVGKTALIEHLAKIAASNDAPTHLRDKKILTLDLALLVAGTSFRGEFEQRLKDIITEASESSDTILFIDEIHTIIGTGNTGGSLDAANILKPSLARGDLQIIGATTHDEYKKHIAGDPALARRFQKITVQEPTAAQTTKILTGAKKAYEKYHNVRFESESLQAAVDLSVRYLPEQHLPDKAFDLLDETAAYLHSKSHDKELFGALSDIKKLLQDLSLQKTNLLRAQQYDAASIIQKQETQAQKKFDKVTAKIAQQKKDTVRVVTKRDIAKTLSHMTNIPEDVLQSTPSARITEAMQKLRRVVAGQDIALKHIADTLTRSATGINNIDRPQGSFLFLGPTGVGKTLTAKTIATEIFGDEKALIRIDMSELMERHASAKLLGAPAGYVGYGEGGTLTEKIKKNPYSVVLFDEIEKAHPDTFNLLLQILEEGLITDGEGTEASFKNAIIILTSNIGAIDATKQNLGFGDSKDSQNTEAYTKAATDFLAPEILSRLDHIITFNQLDKKSLTKITRAEIARIKNNLAQKKIMLSVDTKAIHLLTKNALENADGNTHARSVRTEIQKTLERDLAQHIIANPDTKKITVKTKKTKKEEILVII